MNIKYLDLAARLASEIDPNVVRPNPRVGCIIVNSDQLIVNSQVGQREELKSSNLQNSKFKIQNLHSDVHEKFGSHHAEVNAISSVSSDFDWSDAEVYITLEPCDHFEGKKTPSCTELLISKKPKKVVIGNLDPQFCGKNVEKLKRAGIEVEVVDHKPSRDLNPYFRTFITQKRPYVCLKMAMSLDGKISSTRVRCEPGLGNLRYISNEKSRERVHQMRSQFSAILTTTETVEIDNPKLDVRLSGRDRNPDLLIFGSRALSSDLNIFKIPNRKIHSFDGKDLKSDLQKIASLGYDSIFTECGAKMATELLLQDLVDEIVLFVVPKVFGKGKNVFAKEISLQKFSLIEAQSLENDIMVKFQRKG